MIKNEIVVCAMVLVGCIGIGGCHTKEKGGSSGVVEEAAEGMERFGQNWVEDVYRCLDIRRANMSKDGRSIWLVCDSHNSLFSLVCRYDLREKAFWVLTDGDSADEEPDGTIWVLNKKIYLTDKNGEPDGAAWREEWITPDGKVVRKGEPRRAEDVLCYEEAVKLRQKK